MQPSLDVRLAHFVVGSVGLSASGRAPVAAGPRWDVSGPCLYLDGQPIKKFRKRVGWHVVLFAAFESLGWPAEPIPQPLPKQDGDTPDDLRERLHNLIQYLNRELPPGTIRFWTDGARVGWTRCPPAAG
jgi:hypothetical protein